ncbi:MAG TPA: NIPSNAP family protein [Longimicrobiaceae bacterium]|nr:NIPSNAP family protein [Longimicrobiaceae bacterium]
MIQVREVFQLHFGKAREAVALAREGVEIEQRLGLGSTSRILTDLTGEYYTLVLEMEMDNLQEMEEGLQKAGQDEEWRAWYARFSPLVRSGRREVYRVVEQPAPRKVEAAVVAETVVRS